MLRMGHYVSPIPAITGKSGRFRGFVIYPDKMSAVLDGAINGNQAARDRAKRMSETSYRIYRDSPDLVGYVESGKDPRTAL